MPDKSFCTTSVQVFFGLPLGLAPSTSYSIHSFIQSVSSFRSICPYHHNLFCWLQQNVAYIMVKIYQQHQPLKKLSRSLLIHSEKFDTQNWCETETAALQILSKVRLRWGTGTPLGGPWDKGHVPVLYYVAFTPLNRITDYSFWHASSTLKINSYSLHQSHHSFLMYFVMQLRSLSSVSPPFLP